VKLSVVIITFNEERNIGRCIDSVQKVADEIVIVDSYSTDKTESICKGKGAKFIQHKFEGHIEQKNFAISQATNKYILSLDADEALSEELVKSILEVKDNWTADGYKFNRLTNYCGSWIRHCGWYPDTKLRLWDSSKGKWGGTNPHDIFIMNSESKILPLKGDLFHYSYYSTHDHLKQVNYFTDITSKEAYTRRKRSNLFLILFSPLIKFLKSYFFQLGFMDGYHGFVISVISAHATFLKYVKVKELQERNG
jgi:glycosyltransferase involved in cell wall biosynthesis